jgi:hypothetical protein
VKVPLVSGLIGFAFWLALGGAAAAQGTIEVRVTAGGEPVRTATVTLHSLPDSVPFSTTETDSAGMARFTGVPAGRYTVATARLGFTAAEAAVNVAGGLVARVELVVRQQVVDLPVVVVEAQRRRARFEETAGVTVSELTQRDLKLLPALGEPDVLRAVEVLPGVVSTSDFSSSFNVRGGSADQNLILLDGLPVFNPFHLGGLFSVFNADMVSRAELMAGGFPAQYGGRVSSVLGVESDAGRPGVDVQTGVSLLSARVAAGVDVPDDWLPGELSAGRARLSVRRSYFDQLLKPFFDFPYHLTDAQFFGEAWTPGGGRLTLTGYTGRDLLDLAGTDSFPLQVRWQWGNDVIGAGWTAPIAGDRLVRLRVGHSRFDTDIGFPEFGDTEFRSRIDQTLLRAEATAFAFGARLGGGVAADRMEYDNLALAAGTVFGEGADSGWLLGSYLQADAGIGDWLLEAGVRIDAWLPGSRGAMTAVQPRFAVKRFIDGDRAVKLAVGRYAQFLHSLRDEELPLGIDVWVLAGDRAPAVISDQIQLGLEAFIGSWFAAAETFYRTFDGVTANNTAEDPNDPLDDLLVGRGRSYGADLQLRRDAGRVRPMLAVSWLHATREFPTAQLSYPPIFDRRLDLDLVLQAMLPWRLELGARWSLGTGLPYTRPLGAYLHYDYSFIDGRWRLPSEPTDTLDTAVVLGARNAERYPVYHRLDVSLRRPSVRRWGTLTPYLDVLNVYDKRNVLFYFYQYDRVPPTRAGISMFPLLPTAGLEVRF